MALGRLAGTLGSAAGPGSLVFDAELGLCRIDEVNPGPDPDLNPNPSPNPSPNSSLPLSLTLTLTLTLTRSSPPSTAGASTFASAWRTLSPRERPSASGREVKSWWRCCNALHAHAVTRMR